MRLRGKKRKNLIDNRPRRFTLNPLYAMKTEVLWYLGERSIEIRETEIPEFETREVLQRSPPRATPFRAKIGSQRNFHRTNNIAVTIGTEPKLFEKSQSKEDTVKKISLLLACLLALLWVACEEEIPDYVGTWVDSTTLVAVATTVTFDLSAEAGNIFIDKPVGDDVEVIGILENDGSTLTATITQITVGSTVYTGALLDGFLALLTPPLTTVNTFTYGVAGNTLTITGNLISALTALYPGGPYTTLTATKT